jgi:YbbR domain-containing protein
VPDPDHIVREVKVSPATVVVAGPSSKVDEVFEAVVEVSATGATGDLRRESALRAVAAEGRQVSGVTLSSATAQVTVIVLRLPDPVLLPVHVQLEGTPALGFGVAEVTSDPMEVGVRAEAAALQNSRWVFTVPVVVEGARESFRQEVDLKLPSGAYRVDPPRVTVNVVIASGFD